MAENIENNGCSQRDNAEHEGYVKASRSFNRIWKERDSAQPRLLETILYKDNFNRAYKRVKANKGAPGIDGMTIEGGSSISKGTSTRDNRPHLSWKVYSVSSKTSHDSQTRWWCAKAWHTNSDRPYTSTGNNPTVSANLLHG